PLDTMTTWAIGDIHGCRETLDRLLDEIDFAPDSDRIWLTGDLVNGGPDSLGVVRWARELGDRATVVLGNHDLHMLAVAAGVHEMNEDDTFEPLLEAPDGDELVDWLRRRPLFHRDGGRALVHAGLLPDWDLEDATALAVEVQQVLRGTDAADFLAEMYGDTPRRWSPDLNGADRLRLIVNAMTRMRTLAPNAALDLDYKGTLDDVPEDRFPWFDHPDRRAPDATLLFGHWSALGFHRAERAVGLDSGCVWGNALTALDLETGDAVQVPSEMPTVFEGD
ncbi:MAG: symmetrical bis(5'-nucleosyl)-tetraphosphatase, partial [Bradymonadaceae bacterium]